MNPQLLNRPYVGIELSTPDYAKVKGLLPIPSYSDTVHSRHEQKIILIFVIDGYVTSSKQFKWLSDIKLGLQDYLFIDFKYVEEFYVHSDTAINGNVYSLQELHNAFKIEYRQYPGIYYAATKKSLYRHLVIHGKKLRHKQLFTMEAMISTALMMNSKLEDKLSHKELHKKVKGAYIFILENKENFKERLSVDDLREAHQRGAELSHKRMAQRTESKVFEALATGKYVKGDGSVNKSLLAAALNISRPTLDKYLKCIAL